MLSLQGPGRIKCLFEKIDKLEAGFEYVKCALGATHTVRPHLEL